jgi:hypothetical protein
VINRLLGSGDQSHVVRNLVSALEPDQFTRLNTFLRRSLGVMLAAGPQLTYRTTVDKLQTESPLIVRFQGHQRRAGALRGGRGAREPCRLVLRALALALGGVRAPGDLLAR